MKVDSFRFVSPLIKRYYQLSRVTKELPIPFTPLGKPLAESRLSLVTTGGLYHSGYDRPFDQERERREPAWGDPSYRVLPTDVDPGEVGVSHLHINPTDVLADVNILLPIERMKELVAEGRVGSLAAKAYSFMGYQGFPADHSGWKERYGPEVLGALHAERVDGVLLTSA
jgi:D-proline reductase (dithiol) PrdB